MGCNNCDVKNSCKKFDRGEYCDEFCVRQFKIDELFNLSNLTVEQRAPKDLWTDPDGTDVGVFTELSNIQSNISKYVRSGKNLYLFSKTAGNGKTSWMVRFAQTFILKNWVESTLKCRVLFINVPRFLIELKSNISVHSEYIEHINNNIAVADLVIWDDIGTKCASEFEHEHLLSLIDMRINMGKSNFYTSNLDIANLGDMVGNRLASRIINTSEVKEFRGKDKRGLSIDSVTDN